MGVDWECIDGRLMLVNKKFGEFFIIEVFCFIERVLVGYFEDYFSERFGMSGSKLGGSVCRLALVCAFNRLCRSVAGQELRHAWRQEARSLAGCSVLQEFEHQLFCRAGVQRSVRSLRGQLCRGAGSSGALLKFETRGVKIFVFGFESFRVSRCFGGRFFGGKGRVVVFPEDGW